MIEQIKSMPWGVKVAVAFLLTLYVTLCVVAPVFWLCVGLAVGAYFAVLRVVHYLKWRE